jgi:hypothetical protein
MKTGSSNLTEINEALLAALKAIMYQNGNKDVDTWWSMRMPAEMRSNARAAIVAADAAIAEGK